MFNDFDDFLPPEEDFDFDPPLNEHYDDLIDTYTWHWRDKNWKSFDLRKIDTRRALNILNWMAKHSTTEADYTKLPQFKYLQKRIPILIKREYYGKNYELSRRSHND